MDDAADIASIVSTAHIAINLSGLEIDMETCQAQIYLEVHVSFQQEPRLFDIRFELLGIFNYAQDCPLETVQRFLQRESLSVMLPSARELLLSLCTRLQVPIVVLPLARLVPSSLSPTTETPSNS
jgi:preprotein translocase subunit SecB